jgi:signal transduction histidine kinase
MGRTTTDTSSTSKGGGHPAIALGVLVTSLALVATSLVLAAIAKPAWGIDQWFWAVDTVDCLVFGFAGWLVLARTRHTVAWILAVTAIGGGLAACGAQWTLVVAEHPDLPVLKGVQLLQSTAWVPGTLALIVILPWLLRDRLTPVGGLAVAAGTALTAWTLFVRVTDPFAGGGGSPISPVAIRSESWEGFIARSAAWENALLVALGLVAAAAVLVRRQRSTTSVDRLGLAWLSAAVGAMAISFLPLALPDPWAAHLPLAFTPLVHIASQALFPVAVLGVVLQQRLWGLELAVRRTLTWWLLTSGLVIVYVTVVAVLGALLPGDDGFTRVLATALVAGGFQPARAWAQRGVDAAVHGDAAHPARVVRQVGRRLGQAGDDDLLAGMTEGIVSSLRLGGARLEASGAGATAERRVVAAVGQVDDGSPDRTVEVPLVHRGATVGALVVSPRANERLDGRSLVSLQELGPVVAASVALAAATEDLRASRARLAEARDEERRVLRRELHDGLGPALAGVGLGLQAGRNLLERDPAAAADLLDALAGELDLRVEEVRDLARGLLPPTLEEHGLAPALVELAERRRVGGLAVELELGALPALAPEVGTAVYAIVAEAVRNVDRHAGATTCRIAVDHVEGLRVVVSDDGVGIGPGAIPGVGTRSMRERAEGIGGTVSVRAAAPRGTEVEVRLPATAPAPTAAAP